MRLEGDSMQIYDEIEKRLTQLTMPNVYVIN